MKICLQFELKNLTTIDVDIAQLNLNALYASLKGKGKSESFDSGKVGSDGGSSVEDFRRLSDLNLVASRVLDLVFDYKVFEKDVLVELQVHSNYFEKVFRTLDQIFVHVGMKKSAEVMFCICYALILCLLLPYCILFVFVIYSYCSHLYSSCCNVGSKM